MTEEQWLASADPEGMLRFLEGRATDRKLRLFSCACCRLLLVKVTVNRRDRRAVDVAELFADGSASLDALQEAAAATTPDWTAAYACAEAASPEGGVDAAIYSADNAAHEAGEHAVYLVDADAGDEHPAFTAGREAERAAQAALLRDIFGNPFRIIQQEAPLSPLVLSLARAAYDERRLPSWEFDPARLAVLSDALEEAGCASGEMLGHLRSPGPHVRGCWAVDLILGKF